MNKDAVQFFRICLYDVFNLQVLVLQFNVRIYKNAQAKFTEMANFDVIISISKYHTSLMV